MKKYCTRCGKPMDIDATFCVECGTANKGEYKHSFFSDDEEVTYNKFATLGIVLGIMVPHVGLALSIIGYCYAKRHNDIGKKPAMVGIIISAIAMTLWFLLYIISAILQN